MSDFRVVLITASATDEAERIARALVDERLAACVNIIPSVRSIYRWKGKVESEDEVLLVAKSSHRLFDRLSARIVELHSYDVPEIVALDPAEMSPAYRAFLEDALPE